MTFPAQITIPRAVLRIARRLEEAGFETWCVGGAIRDTLLHYDNADVDLATAATPEQVQQCFSRTIPIGIEHGTVAVLDRHNRPHEVTTFRRDVKTDGRHAEVEFGVSLDEDLARRDFTINAIAYHPFRHEWRDPFNGESDLGRRLVRAVGDPDRRFREDYLRIVRALRFAARFGFRIEEGTRQAAARSIEGLRALSAERVRDEWFKGLTTADSVAAFVTSWQDIGAAAIWLPELAPPEPSKLKRLHRFGDRDAVLLTSYLSTDPEVTLRRLRCSNAEIARGKRLADLAGMLPDPASDVEVRRWLARALDAADDLVTIAGVNGEASSLAEVVQRMRDSGVPLHLGDLAICGDDLLALGFRPGPAVGSALRQLLDDVLRDPGMNRRDLLLARARVLRDQAAPSVPMYEGPNPPGPGA